jgi:hypothetical protein
MNEGETGSGVSLRYSGLQIDRSTSDPASLRIVLLKGI